MSVFRWLWFFVKLFFAYVIPTFAFFAVGSFLDSMFRFDNFFFRWFALAGIILAIRWMLRIIYYTPPWKPSHGSAKNKS